MKEGTLECTVTVETQVESRYVLQCEKKNNTKSALITKTR